MPHYDSAKDTFVTKTTEVVESWVLKHPEKRASGRMNYQTYRAIIRRFGDSYSTSRNKTVKYEWKTSL